MFVAMIEVESHYICLYLWWILEIIYIICICMYILFHYIHTLLFLYFILPSYSFLFKFALVFTTIINILNKNNMCVHKVVGDCIHWIHTWYNSKVINSALIFINYVFMETSNRTCILLMQDRKMKASDKSFHFFLGLLIHKSFSHLFRHYSIYATWIFLQTSLIHLSC